MYIHVMVLKSRVDLRRVGRGGHDHSLFFENYFASFLLTNKKYHYVAGKCTGYPFPNFLDPPLLMCAITCTGKSTMPLNSLATCVTRLREKLNKDNSNVGNWWRPPLPVFLYWKPFQKGYKRTPCVRLSVELKFVLRPIYEEIHTKLLDTHIYFKFPSAASALWIFHLVTCDNPGQK